MGKEFEKEWIHIYVYIGLAKKLSGASHALNFWATQQLSHFAVHLKLNTALLTNHLQKKVRNPQIAQKAPLD